MEHNFNIKLHNVKTNKKCEYNKCSLRKAIEIIKEAKKNKLEYTLNKKQKEYRLTDKNAVICKTLTQKATYSIFKPGLKLIETGEVESLLNENDYEILRSIYDKTKTSIINKYINVYNESGELHAFCLGLYSFKKVKTENINKFKIMNENTCQKEYKKEKSISSYEISL
jgi:hypothetical protein